MGEEAGDDDGNAPGEEPDATFSTRYNRAHADNTRCPYPFKKDQDAERDAWTERQRKLASRATEATDDERLQELVRVPPSTLLPGMHSVTLSSLRCMMSTV